MAAFEEAEIVRRTGGVPGKPALPDIQNDIGPLQKGVHARVEGDRTIDVRESGEAGFGIETF